MYFIRSRLIILILSVFITVGCGVQTHVLLIKDSPIMGVNQASLDDIKLAIIEGGQFAGWKMQPVKPGLIEATINYEGLVAVVNVHYRAGSYDLLYKSSENLSYEDNKIHSRYNRWLIRLDKAIRKSVQRLK